MITVAVASRAVDRCRGAKHPRLHRPGSIHDPPKHSRMLHGRGRRAGRAAGEGDLSGLENPGADWVKLEVLGDKKTLLPDPMRPCRRPKPSSRTGSRSWSTRPMTRSLPGASRKREPHRSCPLAARSAAARSPERQQHPHLHRVPERERPQLPSHRRRRGRIRERCVRGDGTGAAMACLLNTAIASADDPLRMAYAMKYACWAGRYSYQSGRIPKKLYATASAPTPGW